jgi:hypothetical protein
MNDIVHKEKNQRRESVSEEPSVNKNACQDSGTFSK